MGEIITIVNRKGGVGKTATAHALGIGLCNKGFKVLFIDLDSQANLSHSLKARDGTPSSLDALTQKIDVKDIIQTLDKGYIISADQRLAGADMQISGIGKEYKLKELLEPIKKSYDYILIDTPAQLGTLTINALTASNSIIIPMQADIYSIQGVTHLYDAVATVKRYCNSDLFIKGILLTRYNSRSILTRDLTESIKELANKIDTIVFNTPIRECISIKEAQARQQDIYSYAPRSNATKDYLSYVEEFLNVKGAVKNG